MLTALSIRDVVLIEALDLEFGAGLGVLTGETGAGKSILLDALGLALGARGDASLVRDGANQAIVTASFDPAGIGGAIPDLLREQGIEVEAGELLIVRRIVKADGGSRAFLNDQAVSVALLRDIGARLVEIHGQHDDRGLLNPRGHRALLDAFAGVDAGGLAARHAAWRAAVDAVADARAAHDAAERDRDWLAHAVAELNELAPEPGEEAALAERRATMQRGERVAGELSSIDDLLDGGEGALARLRHAARVVERIGDAHPLIGEALAAIDRALIEANGASEQIAAAAEQLAFDPRQLEADETRLFGLRAAARKHRVQPDDLAALTEQLSTRLALIEGGEETLARLEAAAGEARDAFAEAARAVSVVRHEAAARLDAAVAGELVPLKLDAARFRTDIAELPQDQWSPAGIDRVEFLVSTNAGTPFGALGKIASGGELSRFILALKVALAERGGAATLIFDEIDRGVGGAVASAIGDRLARLASGAQLLVVTHSPQVAARGRHHLLIAKSREGTVTRTGVRALDADERREEIARMLSGATVTDEARAQADRLLEPA